MKTKPFSSRAQGPRAERQGMMRRLSKSFSLLPALVLLMIVGTVMAGIGCTTDSQCRRDVCIKNSCSSRPTTGGDCSLDTHCFYAATESCITNKCLARSAAGGDCDSPADCATANSACSSSKCTSPSGTSCSINPECTSPLACIKNLCSTKSSTGGDCDEAADCATAVDTCTGGKCIFDPSLMVWDGNPIASNTGFFNSPSVVVNGILFLFEGYGAGATNIKVEAYDPVAKTWTSKTSPTVSSSGFSVVAVGTNIFLIGGFGSASELKTFYVYDTVGDSWDTTWNQLPEARSSFAAVAVGSTLFIFGGTGAGGTLATIRSLDVSAKGNGWNLLTATLPTATSRLSATAVGNEVFLTGGATQSGTVNTVLKYNTRDPTTSPSSSGLQTLIQARSQHMSFFDPISKRLYAVGGTSNYQDTVEYLDLTVDSSGSWVSANAPNYVSLTISTSGGLIGSLFHFVLAYSPQILDVSVPSSVKWTPFSNSPSPGASIAQMTGPSKITTVDLNYNQKTSFYDIATDTWTAGAASTNYPITVNDGTSAVVNGEVYVMGGASGTNGVKNVYALNAAGTTWAPKDDIPLGRIGGCAAASGTDIYFYGGSLTTSAAPSSDLFLMDTTKPKGSNLQWTTVTPAGATPTAVNYCAAVVAGQKLLIFGGGTAARGGTPTGLIQSFNIPTKTWDPPFVDPVAITARSWLSAVYLKGFVFVIGGLPVSGSKATAKVEVFDVTAQTVSAIKDIPTPRYSFGSVTDGASVFSVAGQLSVGFPFSSIEKLRAP